MVNGMGLWNWAYHISLRCNIKYPHRNPGSVLDLSICCPILRGSMGNSSAGEGQSMSANSPSKFLELSHVIYSWRSGLWLVGGLEHGRSPSFFRGVGIPPTSIIYNYIYTQVEHPNPPTSQSTNIPTSSRCLFKLGCCWISQGPPGWAARLPGSVSLAAGSLKWSRLRIMPVT